MKKIKETTFMQIALSKKHKESLFFFKIEKERILGIYGLTINTDLSKFERRRNRNADLVTALDNVDLI